MGGRIGAFDSSSSYTRTHTYEDRRRQDDAKHTKHTTLVPGLGVPGFREARAVVAVDRPLRELGLLSAGRHEVHLPRAAPVVFCQLVG